jgi:integrase/recombinase XerD
MTNELFVISNSLSQSSSPIFTLVEKMLDNSIYNELIDTIDDVGYQSFNDLEMIYLFVHKEKDINEQKNRSQDTKKEYLRDLLLFYKHLLEYGEKFEFNVINLDIHSVFKSLTPRTLRKYQQWIKTAPLGKSGKPYAVSTLAKKFVIIKSFLSFLYKSGYIKKPLHEHILSASVREEDRPNRDLNSEEVVQLLLYYKDHPIIGCLLAVLTTTGLRIRELVQSRICDLSYSDGMYWLEVKGKGNKNREVLIYPNVFEKIVAFRKRRGLDTILDPEDTSPIFVTATLKPYSYRYLSNYLTNAIQKTNLPFVKHRKNKITCHALRHAFAIISAENGADIYKISKTLGHSQIKTTMIYLEKHLARQNNAARVWKNSEVLKHI